MSATGKGGAAAELDVYAPPYIPLKLKQVNEVLVPQIICQPAPWIEFASYVVAFAGTFLSARPPPPGLPPANDRHMPASLDQECYEQFFSAALQIEADCLSRDLEQHHLYQVPLLQTPYDVGHSMYRLVVPGLRETNLPIEVGDVVRLRPLLYDGYGGIVTFSGNFDLGGLPVPGRDGVCYNAVVWVMDRFNETLHLRVDNLIAGSGLFNACFTAQTSRMAATHAAVVAAARHVEQQQAWLRAMTFPCPEDGRQQTTVNAAHHDLTLHDELLNHEQIRAITTVLREDYGRVPYLISGPPGTGKTKTVVELSLQMLALDETKHLLLCAPSDSAADTLATRLSAHLSPKELLRLNSPARNFPEVPNAILPYCYVDDRIFSLPPFAELMGKQIVVTTVRDAELLRRARLTNADLFSHELSIFTAYHPRSFSPRIQLHWDALIIDEAAQATEPEALIPLLVLAPPLSSHLVVRHPQVIMVGDQCQLGPRTASKRAALQKSLFERLLARPLYSEHPLSRARGHGGHVPRLTSDMLPLIRPPFADLVRNYRSHPAILAIPSSLFYHDTLEPVGSDTDALLEWPGFAGRDFPILFHNSRSPDEIEQDGGGWYNLQEAKIAIDHAASFLVHGVKPSEVCVMSPFRAQVKVLRTNARARGYSMAGVNIGPLEAYQGLEFRVVILCSTRTRNRFIDQDIARGLGVIYEPKRFNMALTRAKQAMVVIGNPDVLDQDPNWAAFLAFCKRNGAWKSDSQYIWQPPYGENIRHSRLEKQLYARHILQEGQVNLATGMRQLGLSSNPDTAAYEAGIAAEEAALKGELEGDHLLVHGDSV